jgi:CRP-like cAMP-binding protein
MVEEYFNRLKFYINQVTYIPDEVFDAGKSYFYFKQYRRNEYLHKSQNVCNEIAFILDGGVRSFYNMEGTEITRFVILKNNFVTALSSYISREVNPENIQAIMTTKALVIKKENLDKLYEQHHEWERLGRKAIEHSHLQLEKRVLALISMTAEERYKSLSIEQPELLKYVPLQYIASILGIKPETLSRIRKKLSL